MSARRATLLLAMAALAGCAGLRTTAVREDAPQPPPNTLAPSPTLSAPAVPAAPIAEPVAASDREHQQQLSRQIHAHVARRMPRHPPTVHRHVTDAVISESTKAEVDPLLVLAVIHIESSFDPRAVSSAGAIGLMQIRVPTLREELRRPRARRADAYDPLTNVQGGVRYLRRLLDRFGATDVALMAYNAGPRRIREFVARGTIPSPIREYSRRVRSEVERLRLALGEPAKTPTLP